MKTNLPHCQKNARAIVVGKFDECFFEVPIAHLPGAKERPKLSPVKSAASPVRKPPVPAGDYLIAILFDGKRYLFRDRLHAGQPLPAPTAPAPDQPAK